MVKRTLALAIGVLALLGLAATPAAQAEVADGWDYRSLSVSGTYQPLVGQFAGDGATDILWYAPGSAPDSLWIGKAGQRGAAAFTKLALEINGTYTPVVGDFFGDDYSDIIWYAPGPASDFAWVSDDVPGYFGRQSVAINGRFRPSVLEDYSAANRKDDVLWYAPGSAKDYLWHFGETGTGAYSTVNLSINGTYQTILGDWNADGLGDLVLYAPGTAADYRWASKPDGTFAQSALSVNGTYEPVTILQDDGDGILWWADGPAREAYWVRNGATFRSASVPAVSELGAVTSAGLGGAIITVPGGVDGFFFGDATQGDWYGLAGLGHDKTTQRPLVGDYDDDGLIDVTWYGRGTLSDELWYSVPSAMSSAQRSGAALELPAAR
jgi:hypothetical protein